MVKTKNKLPRESIQLKKTRSNNIKGESLLENIITTTKHFVFSNNKRQENIYIRIFLISKCVL